MDVLQPEDIHQGPRHGIVVLILMIGICWMKYMLLKNQLEIVLTLCVELNVAKVLENVENKPGNIIKWRANPH